MSIQSYKFNFCNFRKIAGSSSKQKKLETKQSIVKDVEMSVKPSKAEMPLKQPKSIAREPIDDDKFSRNIGVSTPSEQNRKSSTKTWTDEELLCQLKCLDYETSCGIVRMFDEGNTIPFMCRYRRELIGNLDADE